MFDELKSPQQNPLAPRTFLASSRTSKEADDEAETASEEESCGTAFGYLRGVRDRALALQLRYRTGDSEWFSYGLLAAWRYNPSVGILLKFTSDLVSLVLIRGSNLDAMINNHAINLTDRGLQRHRITWIREMDEDELSKAGEGEPTIDRFEVGEFETKEEALEWLRKTAPVFLR